MPGWWQPDFEWDEMNAGHLLDRHGIDPRQVEEVFFNQPHVERGKGVYQAYGQDDAGRHLFVVFVLRANGLVRAISARPMSARERRLYDRHR